MDPKKIDVFRREDIERMVPIFIPLGEVVTEEKVFEGKWRCTHRCMTDNLP